MSELAAAALACSRCDSRLEHGDLRCPICALAILRPVRGDVSRAAPPAVRAAILRCDGCGAAVAYDVAAREPKCAFCAAVMHVERPLDPPEVAEVTLPFRVTPAEAKAALGRFLGKRDFFRPPDLVAAAKLESMRALVWPAWVVSARALVSWTADSNAGARRAPWAPHAGQLSMELDQLLVPATRGLTAAECARLAPHFQPGTAEVSPTLPDGATVETFDVPRSAARRLVLEQIREAAKHRLAGVIPGTRHRKLDLAILLEQLETRRCALPTYVMAYRYGGELHRVIVHGQDASVAFGSMPWSRLRIAAAVILALAVAIGGAALLALAQ